MSDTRDQAEARWAAAASLAKGVTDEGLRDRRARILARVIPLLVVIWIAGVIIAMLLPRGAATGGTNAAPSGSRVLAQYIFLGLGLTVGIAGFVWAKRTGKYVTKWTAIASPLTRAEKKNVQNQISGKMPVDQAHLPIILAIATENRRTVLGNAPIYFAIENFAVSTAIISNALYIKLLELLVSLMFVGITIQLVALFRRAGRFISANRTH